MLSGPNIHRAWFLELDLPSGWSYLHSGVGRFTISSKEWRGVSDPIGGRLVSFSRVEEGRFGQATAIKVTLSGANREFLRSIHTTAAEIEGRNANLYFGVFDAETQTINTDIGLKRVFPGLMSSPELEWGGAGLRTASITLESRWAGLRFPLNQKWNAAGQRKRYAGDKGLDLVGVKTAETYR